MIAIVAEAEQAIRLNVFQRAVRDHLQQGGSFLEVLLAVAVILGVLVAAWFLTRRLERRANPPDTADPKALFDTLLARLGLDPRQRGFLANVASHAGLRNPTVLLLSPELFDTCTGAYLSARENGGEKNATRSIPVDADEMRAHLFPAA